MTDISPAEALSRLIIRLYQTPIRGEFDPAGRDWAHRVDLAGTCSVLALEWDDGFEIVHRCDLARWGIPEQRAFEKAQANVNQAPMDITPLEFEPFEVCSVQSEYLAAAKSLDMAHQCPQLPGQHGALVAVSSSSVSLVAPLHEINHEALSHRFLHLLDSSYDIYSQATHPITYHIYWWRENVFHRFNFETTTKGMMFQLPHGLWRLWWPDVEAIANRFGLEQNGPTPEPQAATAPHESENSQITSINTSIDTGRVVILTHNRLGKILGKADDFQMENFEEAKRLIHQAFKK